MTTVLNVSGIDKIWKFTKDKQLQHIKIGVKLANKKKNLLSLFTISIDISE